MKLMFFLAVWQRPEITEICFMGLKRLGVEAVAVISEESMISLCEKYGVRWVMTDNYPLEAKKNTGLRFAERFDFDFLIEIGSDDLILGELIDQYQKFFVKYDFFGVTDAAYIDAETLRCCRLQSPAVYGAGRAISRKALEKMNWTLWAPKGRGKGMDKSSLRNMYNAGFQYWQIPAIDYPLVIDIKSPVNIWPFRNYWKLGVRYDIEEIYSRISEQEVNAIKCLPQVYQSASLIER